MPHGRHGPPAPALRAGFVPVVRLHKTCHRLPASLDEAEEKRLATRAVARLRAVSYPVDCDDAFAIETREGHHVPLGAQIAHLAGRIREATTTDQVADALTELTTSHDGVQIALGEVLTANRRVVPGPGPAAGPIHREAAALPRRAPTRPHPVRPGAHPSDLADRHQDHPQRRARTAEAGRTNTKHPPSAPSPPPLALSPAHRLQPAGGANP